LNQQIFVIPWYNVAYFFTFVKNKINMKHAFLFDMDGTMIDNMMVHHRAWQKTLNDLGLSLTLEEVRQSIHGINTEIIARLFGDRFTVAERIEIGNQKEAVYRAIFKDDLCLIDGLEIFLQDAVNQNIAMGIGTAAPRENVTFAIETLSLQRYFSVVKDAADVQKGKPAPEVFLKVAAELNVPIERCIVFEDSPTGVGAAHNAGCKAIVVTSTHTEAEFAHFPNVVLFIKDYTALRVESVLKLM
jgi:beta-phosphoglucomutase family hydrolase